MTTKEIGDFGETMACRWLEKNGMSVIKRNFRCRSGEIDIIAKDGETIVFCEVKTRLSKSYGTPAEFVDYRKQQKITRTALFYLGRDDVDMRFDVVEVMYRICGDVLAVTEINHIKAAF